MSKNIKKIYKQDIIQAYKMQAKICLSTKKRIDNDQGAVMFMCPSCSEFEIVRSSFARKNAIKYTCPSCKFQGPN